MGLFGAFQVPAGHPSCSSCTATHTQLGGQHGSLLPLQLWQSWSQRSHGHTWTSSGAQQALGHSRHERRCGSWRASRAAVLAAGGTTEAVTSREGQVLRALSRILDPDFGMDIVACGFVKDLRVDTSTGAVSFRLELTTPACPIKDEFEQKARQYVAELDWVSSVSVEMSAQPPRALGPDDDRPNGLRSVANVIAVSSCKGGVGKSTVAVNLAYTLAQMGAKVGIMDADVYGPSLPTMISPAIRVLQMDPETRSITPVDYEGVKAVSFGFAGQGTAIMRGPMVSGLVNQLLTTTQWGELDYLVVDFPPGTGDIQLTLCQTVAFTAAVIVTTPQNMAFVDVAKGIKMFARLAVPCVAIVENMSSFVADGKTYYPFGRGAGDRIQRDFGLPNLVHLPIVPDLSAAGDGGRPLVAADPTCETANSFMKLGAAVVREIAKLKRVSRNAVRYDAELHAFVVSLPSATEEFHLHPATVRRSDRSAATIDEWTGERLRRSEDIPEDVTPAKAEGSGGYAIQPLGNYAVQITWEDGFNQVAPFDILAGLDRMSPQQLQQRHQPVPLSHDLSSPAQRILAASTS